MSKLETLVNSYGEHNYEKNALKKVCDTENAEIKEIMTKENLKEFSTDTYTAKISVTEDDVMNEDAMLKVLKKDWSKKYGSMECPYIKTKEYVDMDVLESVMYAGELSKETMLELDKCKSVKTTVKLTISKVKKSKKEET